MPDNRILSGGSGSGKEAVCVHTKKVFDACRSQDCLEDLRVFLTCESQAIVDRALNVKPKSAKILWTYVDVEPVPFNDGFYTVDAKFFYKVTADAFCGLGRPVEVEGLAMFDKRVILFGSDGKSKTFSSQMVNQEGDDRQLLPKTNLPIATVEVVDPIVLSTKLVEPHDRFCGSDKGHSIYGDIPESICGCFRSQLSPGEDSRRLYVTLGQFAIIRLERDTQLLIPSFDYCVPEKECPSSDDKDPCDIFARFRFPTNEFFPPDNKPGDKYGCKK